MLCRSLFQDTHIKELQLIPYAFYVTIWHNCSVITLNQMSGICPMTVIKIPHWRQIYRIEQTVSDSSAHKNLHISIL